VVEAAAKCSPPFSEDEALKKVAGAYARYAPAERAPEPDSAGGGGARSFAVPVLRRLDTVEPEPVEWLWPDRLARGKLTAIVGDPGLGKSLVTVDIAARLTSGRAFPDGHAAQPADVLLLTCEDGIADTVRPRIDAAGGDPSKVHILEGIRAPDDERVEPFAMPIDLPALEQAIRACQAGVVIVDPLNGFLSGVNSWRDQDIRRALSPLTALAERTKAAIILVAHLNKAVGLQGLYRVGGSIGLPAAVRTVLLVAPNPDASERRVLAGFKNNLGETAPSLGFHIERAANGAGRIVWEGPTTHAASQLLATVGETERNALEEAKDFLRTVLGGEEPVAADTVKREAAKAGIADITLRRAREALGVKVQRRGFGKGATWVWTLPEPHRCSSEAIDAHSYEMSIYGENEHLWQSSNGVAHQDEDPWADVATCSGCGRLIDWGETTCERCRR
jgi:hypothetical protein